MSKESFRKPSRCCHSDEASAGIEQHLSFESCYGSVTLKVSTAPAGGTVTALCEGFSMEMETRPVSW